jgi:hypothetical protein
VLLWFLGELPPASTSILLIDVLVRALQLPVVLLLPWGGTCVLTIAARALQKVTTLVVVLRFAARILEPQRRSRAIVGCVPASLEAVLVVVVIVCHVVRVARPMCTSASVSATTTTATSAALIALRSAAAAATALLRKILAQESPLYLSPLLPAARSAGTRRGPLRWWLRVRLRPSWRRVRLRFGVRRIRGGVLLAVAAIVSPVAWLSAHLHGFVLRHPPEEAMLWPRFIGRRRVRLLGLLGLARLCTVLCAHARGLVGLVSGHVEVAGGGEAPISCRTSRLALLGFHLGAGLRITRRAGRALGGRGLHVLFVLLHACVK